MAKLKALYVWDEKLIEECDRLPAVPGRASMVHSLIDAYGILQNSIKVVRSTPASYKDLKEFHSDLYLDHLKTFKDIDDEYMSNTEDEEYGIGYDCPPVANMFELISTIAGGSLTAAKCLLLGVADVAINWCGGWHHAQRFGAEGFCYVNDIVLAIEKLKLKFPRILYIDLDVHHGNGVQDAYNLSNSVFTLSFHKFEPGFYPNTGCVDDIGMLVGKGYTCNFPLHASYSDDTLEYAFKKVFTSIYDKFSPHAIVVQCGADALAHDGACVTVSGYSACLRAVLDRRKPTILFGGGGYNHPNTSRLWTSLAALVAGVTLDENIPEHTHWPKYGPNYTIHLEPTLVRDGNKKEYLDECIATIEGNLNKYLRNNQTESPTGQSKKSELQIYEENKENRLHCEKRDGHETKKNTHSIFKKINDISNEVKNVADVYDFTE